LQFTAPLVATSPVGASPYHSPTATSLGASNKERHSNLTVILGIGAGIMFFAIVFVIIICLCAFRQGKTKASLVETGIYPLILGPYISLGLYALLRVNNNLYNHPVTTC
jgi:hypothetical protein